MIRMGYGDNELYTRWSQRSLGQWKELAQANAQRPFVETAVLWMARDEDPLTLSTLATLQPLGIPHERR